MNRIHKIKKLNLQKLARYKDTDDDDSFGNLLHLTPRRSTVEEVEAEGEKDLGDDLGLDDDSINLKERLTNKFRRKEKFSPGVTKSFENFKVTTKLIYDQVDQIQHKEEEMLENIEYLVSIFSSPTSDTLEINDEIRLKCRNIIQIFENIPEIQHRINELKYNGLFEDILFLLNLPVVNPLSLLITDTMLQLLNIITQDDTMLLITLCLLGIVPTILKYTTALYTFNIRNEVSVFINKLVYKDDLTLKIFLSNRGYKVLSELVDIKDKDFVKEKTIIYRSLDCILYVLLCKSYFVSTNKFCRLFITNNVFERIMVLMKKILQFELTERDDLINDFIAFITLLLSNSDSISKKELVQNKMALPLLFENLFLLKGEQRLLVLKSINNLLKDPVTHVYFDDIDVVIKLVPFLDLDSNCINQVLNGLYNYSLNNNERYEKTASYGVVKPLKEILTNKTDNKVVKGFAFELLCSLSSSGLNGRMELFKYDCHDCFIEMIKEKCWRNKSLQTMSAWILQDRNLDYKISVRESAKKFLTYITSLSVPEFLSSLSSLYKIFFMCSKFREKFASSSTFVKYLAFAMKNANTVYHKVMIMRILKSFCKVLSNCKNIFEEFKDIIKDLFENNKETTAREKIIHSMATDLYSLLSKESEDVIIDELDDHNKSKTLNDPDDIVLTAEEEKLKRSLFFLSDEEGGKENDLDDIELTEEEKSITEELKSLLENVGEEINKTKRRSSHKSHSPSSKKRRRRKISKRRNKRRGGSLRKPDESQSLSINVVDDEDDIYSYRDRRRDSPSNRQLFSPKHRKRKHRPKIRRTKSTRRIKPEEDIDIDIKLGLRKSKSSKLEENVKPRIRKVRSKKHIDEDVEEEGEVEVDIKILDECIVDDSDEEVDDDIDVEDSFFDSILKNYTPNDDDE